MTSGGPRTPSDALRIELENVIALHIDADDHLRVALLRLIQCARTAGDREIIDELLRARQAVAASHSGIVAFHQDRRDTNAGH